MLSTPDIINLLLALALLLAESLARLTAHILRAVLPSFLHPPRAFPASVPPPLRDMDAAALIEARGFPAEEHTIETDDGYFLTLFRIPRGRLGGARGSGAGERVGVGAGPGEERRGSRGPVLVMHGFLENAEVWLAPGEGKGLPFMLAEDGFDVWLGNARGCKYGYKHRRHRPDSHEFWRFSMDEMALYDLPAMVEYIVRVSKRPKLGYVGFSQGTALAFAALSMNVELARRVSLFVALAPSTRVHDLRIGFVNTLVRCDPNIIYLLFGRRRLIGLCIFWRMVLPGPIFVRLIDLSVKILFGWTMRNVDEADKDLYYAHLYSYGSVRTLVHWFQVLSNRRFAMYDEQHDGPRNSKRSYPGNHVPRYPLHQITNPIALFFGGADTLPDTEWLLRELPTPVYVQKEPTYEHLDFQFAASAPTRVYTKIVKLLQDYHQHGNGHDREHG